MTTERTYPPYAEMTMKLLKQMPGDYATLMHAAIGVAGEAAGELGACASRKNLLEECGDIEFYLSVYEQYCMMPKFPYAPLMSRSFGTILQQISAEAGMLLDITKKSWVYTKPLNTEDAELCIYKIRSHLDLLYELMATTREQVLHLNQVKLIGPGGRFESGFYTDAAAIARADKPAGE